MQMASSYGLPSARKAKPRKSPPVLLLDYVIIQMVPHRMPGLLDVTVSGGLTARYTVEKGMAKEAAEEAGISEETLQEAM